MTNQAEFDILTPTNPVQTVAPEKEETEMLRATDKITALYCRLSQEACYVAGEACVRREAEDYPSSGERKLVTPRGRHVSAVRRRIIPLAAKRRNLHSFPHAFQPDEYHGSPYACQSPCTCHKWSAAL